MTWLPLTKPWIFRTDEGQLSQGCYVNNGNKPRRRHAFEAHGQKDSDRPSHTRLSCGRNVRKESFLTQRHYLLVTLHVTARWIEMRAPSCSHTLKLAQPSLIAIAKILSKWNGYNVSLPVVIQSRNLCSAVFSDRKFDLHVGDHEMAMVLSRLTVNRGSNVTK